MPDYTGKVVFVSSITGTTSGDELSRSFNFRYIPTSFFLKPGGGMSSSYTGPLTESEMRARLDALVAR